VPRLRPNRPRQLNPIPQNHDKNKDFYKMNNQFWKVRAIPIKYRPHTVVVSIVGMFVYCLMAHQYYLGFFVPRMVEIK